jgi:hypothetical protein
VDSEEMSNAENEPAQDGSPKEEAQTAEPNGGDSVKQPGEEVGVAPDQQRGRHEAEGKENEDFKQVRDVWLAPEIVNCFEHQGMSQEEQGLDDGDETDQTGCRALSHFLSG